MNPFSDHFAQTVAEVELQIVSQWMAVHGDQRDLLMNDVFELECGKGWMYRLKIYKL